MGGHGGVAVPQCRGDASVHGVVGEGLAQERGDILGLVELDELAFAGALTVEERHERRCGRRHARSRVGHEGVVAVRGVEVGVAPQGGVARHGLHLGAEGAPLLVLTGQAVPRHPDHDDVGADAAHGVVGHAEAVHRLLGVVLDENVGGARQVPQNLQPIGAAQVKGHAQLVAGVALEHGELVPRVGLRLPIGISAEVTLLEEDGLLGRVHHLPPRAADEPVGGLDADDLRAPVGEEHRGVGAGPHLGEVEHADAAEDVGAGRRRRVGHTAPSARRRASSCAERPSSPR